MRRISFFEGVVAALLLAGCASLGFSLLTTLLPTSIALRFMIVATATAYTGYLLIRSREPVGRIAIAVAWVAVCGALWFLQPSMMTHFVTVTLFIWLVRCLYYYSSLFCALGDLSLAGIAAIAGAWTAWETGSVFLSVWTYFLIQAVFVRIPRSMRDNADHDAGSEIERDRFTRAYAAAEAAAQKLTRFS